MYTHHLQAVYTAEIGVYETTDKNDHPRIDEYLEYVGFQPGYAWCAAFVSWTHGQAGYPEPRNAWSPALFPMARRVGDPRPGDVFGIYYNNLRRIGHCGFVDGWGDTHCITVEGNTGPDGAVSGIGDPNHPVRAGPERQGVHRKRRPVRTSHAVARWISP